MNTIVPTKSIKAEKTTLLSYYKKLDRHSKRSIVIGAAALVLQAVLITKINTDAKANIAK